ncbi:hypothetical protein ACFL6S_02165 [Candidatus Poribacteria bacterium]
MPLKLALDLNHDSYAPNETVWIQVIIENPSDTPALAPDLESRNNYFPRFVLTSPGDDQIQEFSLVSEGANGKAVNDLDQIELDADSDEAHRFAVDRIMNTSARGEYSLFCFYQVEDDRIQSNTVSWMQEGPGRVSVAVRPGRGMVEPIFLPCFHMFHGEVLHALFESQLDWDEEQSGNEILYAVPERLIDIGTDARDLYAMTGSVEYPERDRQWIAWLSENAVHAGVHAFGFDHKSLHLPFPVGEIVPNVLDGPDSGCDVLLIGEDQRTLALVEFAYPIVPPPLEYEYDDQEVLFDEDDEEDLMPESEDQARSYDPMDDVDMPEPRLCWTHVLTELPQGIAVARGVGKFAELTGIAFTIQRQEGCEVFYYCFASDAPPGNFQSILIPDADILPATNPALFLDDFGNGQVAVLYQTRLSEGRKEKHIALAQVAFSRQSRPLLDDHMLSRDFGQLLAEPVSAALSFFIGDEKPYICDWVVLLPDNQCLTCQRGYPAQVLNSPHTIAQPLNIISLRDHVFIAAYDEHGMLQFVS